MLVAGFMLALCVAWLWLRTRAKKPRHVAKQTRDVVKELGPHLVEIANGHVWLDGEELELAAGEQHSWPVRGGSLTFTVRRSADGHNVAAGYLTAAGHARTFSTNIHNATKFSIDEFSNIDFAPR